MNAWLQHLDSLPESARLVLFADIQSIISENQSLATEKHNLICEKQSLVERLNDALQEIKYLRSLKFLPSTERGNGTEAELLQADDIRQAMWPDTFG